MDFESVDKKLCNFYMLYLFIQVQDITKRDAEIDIMIEELREAIITEEGKSDRKGLRERMNRKLLIPTLIVIIWIGETFSIYLCLVKNVLAR